MKIQSISCYFVHAPPQFISWYADIGKYKNLDAWVLHIKNRLFENRILPYITKELLLGTNTYIP